MLSVGLLLSQQPMTFELFLGLNAAKAAGLTVAAAFLAIVKVIEWRAISLQCTSVASGPQPPL